MTLVDTNVLLDLITDDAVWVDWSQRKASMAGPVFVNDIVYAELSARFAKVEDVDQLLEEALIEVVRTPRPALFLAGKAFRH